MKLLPKHLYIIGGIIGVSLLVIIGFLLTRSQNAKPVKEDQESVFEEPAEEVPPVSDSVKVSIKGRTEAEITILGVPDGTEEIEYELSYNTKSGSIEGVFGTMTPDASGTKATEEVTFGTCSSGVCRYHEIDGPVSGTFIFSGDYGKQMLEQEFDL